ncbi:TPR repeat-containing protein [Roseateles sp. YR242]|nr:TPR repeat-containing protein [Roseateles sp. YR242]
MAWAGECKMQPTAIPVRVVHARPVALLRVNGQDVPMMVGSGVEHSMLLPAAAKALNLPEGPVPFGTHLSSDKGAIDVHATKVDRLTLGDLELRQVSFLVADFNPGLGIQGILGRNILAAGDTEYDLARGVVRLVFPQGDCEKVNLAYWAGDAPVITAPMASSLSDSDTSIRVPVTINNVKTVAFLNTGSQASALLLSTARKAGIPEDRLQTLGTDKEASTWVTDIDSFQLGGERITDQRLAVDDLDAGGDFGMWLGMDYLMAHRVYVSYLQRKIFATWNGGAVFAKQAGAAENRFDPRFATAAPPPLQEDVEVLARRGELALQFGEYTDGLAYMDRAIALKPDVARQFLTRGRIQQSMGNRSAALKDANEALGLDPRLHDARFLRAGLYTWMNERDLALADLTLLDSTLPRDADHRFRMAMMYDRLNNVTEALKQWDWWISSHSRDVRLGSAFNARCFLRTARHIELSLALQDCKHAVEKDSQSSAFHDSLGWTYLRLGDLPHAKASFDMAIQLKSSQAWSLYGRSLAWLKLGDADRARQDLEAARKVQPEIEKAIREAGLPVHDSAL